MAATLDEYDLLIYPGFMRRPMARWNEDGSCAPMARARGPKGEAFQLMLKPSEIDEDISHIEHEVSGALRDRRECSPSHRAVPAGCQRRSSRRKRESPFVSVFSREQGVSPAKKQKTRETG